MNPQPPPNPPIEHPTDPVIIAPYNPDWPNLFNTEAAQLTAALQPIPTVIEHVGSTAVPGLDAKPVVDIMLGVRHLDQLDRHITAIQSLGYRYYPQYESEMPFRRFFAKPADGPRRFNLHALETAHDFWIKELRFRDLLRAHPKLAADYAALKYQLAIKFRNDRFAYTDAKTDFILAALNTSHPSDTGE